MIAFLFIILPFFWLFIKSKSGLLKFLLLISGYIAIGIFISVSKNELEALKDTGVDLKNTSFTTADIVGVLTALYNLIPLFLIIKDYFKKKETIEGIYEKEKNDTTSFNIYDLNNDIIKISNPYRGIFIVGGAGSGKSKTFFYPILKQMAVKEYTGVLYDFKSPELSNLTEHYYNKYSQGNIKVQRIDFKNVFQSDRVNPLVYVNSSIEATNYAQAFILNLLPEYIQKQDFWSRSVLSLFSGAIWYFKKNKPEIATLPHIISFFISANAQMIVKILSQDKEIKGNLSALTEAIEQGADKQIAGVLGTLKNAIGIFNNPHIFWILSKNEANLDVNSPNEPTMLLIGNDSKLPDTYAPIISLIITIASKLMNEPNKLKSAIVIDEAPTIYLPNFEHIPATARSNKVSVIVGAQDISQMVDKYGQDKANVLISNLGNQFFGRTTNKETAERVVQMFGQREDIEIMQGSSGSGIAGALGMHTNKSKSQTIVKRDRVKIQQVVNFRPGEFVGLIAEGNKKEIYTQLKQGDDEEMNISYRQSISIEELNMNFDKIFDDIEQLIKENTNDFGFR